MKLTRKLSDASYAVLAAATVALMSEPAHAQAGGTVGEMADGVTEQVSNVGKLIVAAGFMVGVVMVVAGLMKLKQAADTQGQQVKYSEGLWRLAIGAGLVAMPALTGVLVSSGGLEATAVSASAGF